MWETGIRTIKWECYFFILKRKESKTMLQLQKPAVQVFAGQIFDMLGRIGRCSSICTKSVKRRKHMRFVRTHLWLFYQKLTLCSAALFEMWKKN